MFSVRPLSFLKAVPPYTSPLRSRQQNSKLTKSTEQPLIPSTSLLFVSRASIDSGTIDSYGVRKRVEAVKNCRRLNKHDMKYNGATPFMSVDPETFVSFDLGKCLAVVVATWVFADLVYFRE